MNTIFYAKINQKNLIFNLDIDATLPKTIIIDQIRLRQILINLIGNAIKFTDKGTITLVIKYVYTNTIKNKINLQIEVIDTGRGVPKKFQKTIFNSFEQTDNNDSVTFGGTGLGLAICSKLTHLLNGSITLQSEVHKGSTFSVILKDIEISLVEIEEKNEEGFEKILFDKAKILIVDDVATNRKLVNSLLLTTDITIIEATNGQESIEIVQNCDDIDLILMDLRMPIMDGYQATSQIKELEDKKDIPIIAFTASVMGKDLKKVEEFGFNGYLRKPIVYKDLENELKKHLKFKVLKNDTREEETTILSDTIKATIPEVLDKLHGKLKNELLVIKDKGDFTLINDFAMKIKNLGEKNSLNLLENYAQNILGAIESFDIDKVDDLLGGYENLCNKLEDLKG